MPDDKTEGAKTYAQIAAEQIATAGTKEYKSSATAQPQTAPATGNTEVKTPPPAEGQPAQGANSVVKTEEPLRQELGKETTVKTGEPAPVTGEQSKTAEPEQPAPSIEDILGLTQKEEETVDVLRTKLSASSQEAHRLVQDRKALESRLKEMGLDIVHTKKGIQFKPNSNMEKNLPDDDIPDVFSQLPKEKQELTDKETAKELVKLAIKELNARKPSFVKHEELEQQVLPEHECQSVLNELTQEKMSNGNPRFQDLNNPELTKLMVRAYNDPSYAWLHRAMNTSRENWKNGARLLYSDAYRAFQVMQSFKQKTATKQQEKQENNQKAPSVQSDSTGISKSVEDMKGVPYAKRAAMEIANAMRR